MRCHEITTYSEFELMATSAVLHIRQATNSSSPCPHNRQFYWFLPSFRSIGIFSLFYRSSTVPTQYSIQRHIVIGVLLWQTFGWVCRSFPVGFGVRSSVRVRKPDMKSNRLLENYSLFNLFGSWTNAMLFQNLRRHSTHRDDCADWPETLPPCWIFDVRRTIKHSVHVYRASLRDSSQDASETQFTHMNHEYDGERKIDWVEERQAEISSTRLFVRTMERRECVYWDWLYYKLRQHSDYWASCGTNVTQSTSAAEPYIYYWIVFYIKFVQIKWQFCCSSD